MTKDSVTIHGRGGATRVILVRRCAVCNKRFYPKRRSARYCSPACKQKQWRIREQARKARHREIIVKLKARGVL